MRIAFDQTLLLLLTGKAMVISGIVSLKCRDKFGSELYFYVNAGNTLYFRLHLFHLEWHSNVTLSGLARQQSWIKV